MATIANPQESAFASTDPDEDVAAIVKHISEHAEELYQNWKAQGLAPSEILACRNDISAAEKFGSVLTPPATQQKQSLSPSPATRTTAAVSSPSSPVVELLYSSPNSLNKTNLQQLVSKFVVEDKARLSSVASATPRHQPPTKQPSLCVAKTYPSSIQHALQKFERNCTASTQQTAKPLLKTRSKPLLKEKPLLNRSTVPTSNGTVVPVSAVPVLLDSNVDAPNELSVPSAASNTWPLKTKLKTADKTESDDSTVAHKYSTMPSRIDKSSAVTSDEFLKEVAKEEEKLMNALKSGLVIAATDNRQSAAMAATALKNSVANNDETDCRNVVEKSSLNRKDRNVTFSMDSCSSGKRNLVRNGRNALLENGSGTTAVNSVDSVSSASQQKSSRTGLGNSLGNGNPVRPFLTRGSVAERVLMFEKCPTELIEKRFKADYGTNATTPWKYSGNDVHSKIKTYSKVANRKSDSSYPPHTTLQRHVKTNKNVFIPRFYYPFGKPANQQQQSTVLKAIKDCFQSLPTHVTIEQFGTITKTCGLPLYWKAPLFLACGGEKLGYVDVNMFLDYWNELTSVCHDDASRFMRIVTKSSMRSYIIPEDLIPLVQDVVNTHPGLTFLKQAPEFHSRYVHTVICRVYYCVNQSWSGQITLSELRKSDFLRAVQLLEEEEDINQVTAYFSYEHFYVIYCKFWELDRDHDLSIGKEDLARHSDHALSTRIIDRIFSRTRNKGRSSQLQEGRMGYTDFVIFLLAEEDKNHPRAIEYWFRCMDLDGDGYLSMYELEYFYDEQLQRMEGMGIECLPFEDCLCQMLDMIQPKVPGKISLSDLKRCKMTPIFFDTFFNLEKYLDHEQRDPFASQRDNDGDQLSDWDRYASEEYELLVAEEGGNGSSEDMDSFKQELEDEEMEHEEADIFSCNMDAILNSSAAKSISFVTKKGAHRINRNNNNYRNGYIMDGYYQPSMIVTDYSGDRKNPSDSSDDYAGDSDEDDGSL